MSMPPSSPRLPSPPPPAELQIGPKSPSGGAAASRQASQMELTMLEANAKRRIHPGTKAEDMAAGPPLIPLNELDSAFQLQEHLAALHYYHTASNTHPLTRTTAVQLATPPASTDRTLWLYELCRFLVSKCNSLIVGFLFDSPPCSAITCPEMRASEWQFLCAVHEQPKSCCAIDYCCHTLDWAANVVTDQKIFPSRFVVLSDAHNKNVAVKNLVNVFRRLHRIFAHAWFQHRGVFWSVEGQTGLYIFFKTVCDMYDLLPGETYKLPPEAEGIESSSADQPETSGEKKQFSSGIPAIAKHPPVQRAEGHTAGDDDDSLHPAGHTNTRRHIRSSPSTGSAVTTVLEADEEDGSDVASRLKHMHISAPADSISDESEAADVPVIVEHDVMDEASPDNTTQAALASKPSQSPTTTQPASQAPLDAGGDGGKSSPENTPSRDGVEEAESAGGSTVQPPAEGSAPEHDGEPSNDDSPTVKEGEVQSGEEVTSPTPAITTDRGLEGNSKAIDEKKTDSESQPEESTQK